MKVAATLILAALSAGCVAAPVARSGYTNEDGFLVRSFADGSASVDLGPDVLDFGWSIDCTVDAMSDRRECSIQSETGGIFIDFGTSPQPRTICIIGHDFPGRTGMIRVDGNQAVATNGKGCAPASSLLSQLASGQMVTTRRVEWPYDTARDHSHTLQGFNKALEVAGRIRAGTMPVTAN